MLSNCSPSLSDHLHFSQVTDRQSGFYHEDGAADIWRACVISQLQDELLQQVSDDRGRDDLPATSQDRTYTQHCRRAHEGLWVIKESL